VFRKGDHAILGFFLLIFLLFFSIDTFVYEKETCKCSFAQNFHLLCPSPLPPPPLGVLFFSLFLILLCFAAQYVDGHNLSLLGWGSGRVYASRWMFSWFTSGVCCLLLYSAVEGRTTVRVLVVVAVSVVVGRMRRCKRYGPLIPVP
jgi:hypothetical protein